MDLQELAQAAVEARLAVQRARETLMAAEEGGKPSDVLKAMRRSLKKAIRLRDRHDARLKEAEKEAGRPAVIGAQHDVLDAGISAPRPKTKLRDDQRYINPTYDPRLDAVWHVYMWDGHKWVFQGGVRKKPNRRKPMTMNRLFAAIRQSHSIAKEVPVRLISAQDDAEREKRGLEMAPPERRGTTRPTEPPAVALATPGKREAPAPVRKIKVATPAPKSAERSPRDIDAAQAVRNIKSPGPRPVAAPKPKPNKARFAVWGAMHGKTYYLGAYNEPKVVSAKSAAMARFPDHVGIKVRPMTALPYSTRNHITDGELVAGVTEMEAP